MNSKTHGYKVVFNNDDLDKLAIEAIESHLEATLGKVIDEKNKTIIFHTNSSTLWEMVTEMRDQQRKEHADEVIREGGYVRDAEEFVGRGNMEELIKALATMDTLRYKFELYDTQFPHLKVWPWQPGPDAPKRMVQVQIRVPEPHDQYQFYFKFRTRNQNLSIMAVPHDASMHEVVGLLSTILAGTFDIIP